MQNGECKNNSQFRFSGWKYRASLRVCKSWPFSFLGDYTLQGDGHPEMQAIDKPEGVDKNPKGGDGHPEMQAIDRYTKPQRFCIAGDGHPEMQAIDRGFAFAILYRSGDGHPEMQAIEN